PAPFTVATIAAVLGEQDDGPLQLIGNILTVFGRLTTWRLLQKTLDVEAHGGLMIDNGSRRRAPRGAVFCLARKWCQSAEEQRQIFGNAFVRTPNGYTRALSKGRTALPKGRMPGKRSPRVVSVFCNGYPKPSSRARREHR